MEKRYETVFILTPVLSEEQAKEAAKQFTQFLKQQKAKVLHEEVWGLRKLAYPIQKKSTGFYFLIEFSTESPTLVKDLETAFKRDERVLRYLTVAMDKYAIEYAEKRKAKLKSSSTISSSKKKRPSAKKVKEEDID
ncbi:MAG TPA: 30S ribosomal protein S6 [Bacteroidia bacterium]|nr:30S ribosomal protein S6 [Bacteroidia bacterium]